ncbi:MAG: globin [Sandaracinaceae bacterium]|nr:globin [Sandaracinaceae bacterium]
MSAPAVKLGGPAPHEDRALLEANLSLVAEREGQLYQRVYAIMFRDHPEADQLFLQYGEERQAEMLSETFTSVFDLLDGESWTPGHVQAMGERHRHGYVVRDEMYAWFSDAIVAALREVSGDAWTAATEAAWERALDAVNALMTGRG